MHAQHCTSISSSSLTDVTHRDVTRSDRPWRPRPGAGGPGVGGRGARETDGTPLTPQPAVPPPARARRRHHGPPRCVTATELRKRGTARRPSRAAISAAWRSDYSERFPIMSAGRRRHRQSVTLRACVASARHAPSRLSRSVTGGGVR